MAKTGNANSNTKTNRQVTEIGCENITISVSLPGRVIWYGLTI